MIQNSVLPFTLASIFFCLMACLQLLFNQQEKDRFVNSPFPNKKSFAQKSKFKTNKNRGKCVAEILRFQ